VTSAGSEQREREEAEQRHQQERHHDGHCPLHPLFKAEPDDREIGEKESGLPPRERERIGEKSAKVERSASARQHAHRVPCKGQRPPADHAIERDDKKTRHDAEVADHAPPGRRALDLGDLAPCPRRVCAAGPSHRHFGNHERQADDEHGGNVKQDKRTPAVLTRKIGEAPQVAEPDRKADRGDQEHQSRRPALAIGISAPAHLFPPESGTGILPRALTARYTSVFMSRGRGAIENLRGRIKETL